MQTITERNLRSVDLNLLVIFDALMAERNVTRAALHNGISQPAMSKALNRLRHLLDDPLFERRDGRMEPTPRALDLAGPIRSALSDISRTLTAPAAPNPRQFSGAVRIAAIDLHQTTLLPALTAELRREAPRLDLRIQVADRDRLYDQLADGEIDLAIAPILVGMPELCAETLWSDRLVTLVSTENRLPLPMTIEAFAAADHVVDAGHVRVAPDGRGASLVELDPRRSGFEKTDRGRPAQLVRDPSRGRRHRPDRHAPEQDRQGRADPGPQHNPGALASGRGERASVLAPARREFAAAGVVVQPHQGDGGGLIDFRSPDPDFGAPRREPRSGIRADPTPSHCEHEAAVAKPQSMPTFDTRATHCQFEPFHSTWLLSQEAFAPTASTPSRANQISKAFERIQNRRPAVATVESPKARGSRQRFDARRPKAVSK